jgi:hypothetical protein
MKGLSFLLALMLMASLCHAKPLDADNIHERVRAERQALKRYFEETDKLMNVFNHKKEKLRDATFLMDTINRVQERTGSEGYLLAVYDCVTNVAAQHDAEQLIRDHYADLARLTATDAKSAHLVARDSKSKELAALATKVEGDIQKIADRYKTLSTNE